MRRSPRAAAALIGAVIALMTALWASDRDIGPVIIRFASDRGIHLGDAIIVSASLTVTAILYSLAVRFAREDRAKFR